MQDENLTALVTGCSQLKHPMSRTMFLHTSYTAVPSHRLRLLLTNFRWLPEFSGNAVHHSFADTRILQYSQCSPKFGSYLSYSRGRSKQWGIS